MNDKQIIKTIAEASDAFSTSLASDDATIIYHVELIQLQAIAEAYHQAKCAESVPVASIEIYPLTNKQVVKFTTHKMFDRNTKLYATPQSSDAEDKLKLAVVKLAENK